MIRFVLFLLVALATQLGGALANEPQVLETRDVVSFEGEGGTTWAVEVAEKASEQATGLMHRPSMEAGTGMLFDFGRTRPVSMWMRNTLIPLDMVFVCADGTVSRVARAEPLDETIVPSGEPVRYVLEVNAGEAAPAGLKRGVRLRSRSGKRFQHVREPGDACGR